MSLSSFVQRIARTIVPAAARYNGVALEGGHWTDHSPIATSVTLTAGAAWVFGAKATLLAAAATDLWVEGLVVSQPSAANQEYHVAITMEAGVAVPAAAQIEAIVPILMGAATIAEFVKVDPPVYIPAGQRIAAALAEQTGAKTLNVWAIHSANK